MSTIRQFPGRGFDVSVCWSEPVELAAQNRSALGGAVGTPPARLWNAVRAKAHAS